MNKKGISPLLGTMLFLGIIFTLALFVMFINQEYPFSHVETSKVNEENVIIWDVCNIGYYLISYVDKIYIENCYAVREGENIFKFEAERNLLSSSFEYADMSSREILRLTDPKKQCQNIRAANRNSILYCLRDKTKCLEIEDNRICNIIDLQEQNKK